MGEPNGNFLTVPTANARRLLQSRRRTGPVLIRNTDAANPIFVGGPTVTATGATRGLSILAGSTLVLDKWNDSLDAIASGGAVDVEVLESSE